MTELLRGYDSIMPGYIPLEAEAVFPYGDGPGAWSHDIRPAARYRYITRLGTPRIDIADFEPGAIWPGDALVRWALRRQAEGRTDHTVYTDRVNYPAVVVAMDRAEIEWHLALAWPQPDGQTAWQPPVPEYRGKPVRAHQAFWGQSVGLEYDGWWIFQPDWLLKP
jgi:hypothetical protein